MFLHHLILIPLLIHLFLFVKLSKSITYESTNELNCDRNVICVPLNSSKCLDITLSYKYSKLNGLLQDFNLNNEFEIHEFLDKWIGLKSVPRCWASIQPLLCTAFFPRCDDEKVPLLSHQFCRNVKMNCKILDQFISSNNIKIPSFLNCNDTNLYQPKCKHDYIEKNLKFNSSAAKCQYPLVSTDDSNIYYKNIEGCALDCDDPLYHRTDKIAFQNFIIWSGFISLIVVLISVISYLPKWSALTLTSKITFYIQLCFLIHYFGWLMQAFMNKKNIVCRPDQTLKYSEPNGGAGLSCLINFVFIYYSSFSILTWYVIMAITLKFSNKKFKTNLFKNSILYFHLCAWSSSFIFTIMAIAFSQIDGNYLYGICFVGFSNKLSRFIFVLMPLTVGSLIFIYGMLNQAIPIRSMIHQSSKLKENLMKRNEYKKTYKKLVVSSFNMFLVLFFSYIVNINKSNDLTEWLESLNNEIMCQLNLNSAFGFKNVCNSNCNKNLKKSLTLDYWIVVFVFGSGILSSLWNFDFITIILWIFEFKQKIDKTVRPDRIEQKNIYFEKLLHNKQDPVKMNLSTVTTNPISNPLSNNNNRELVQSKTNDSISSNAHKLYQQKILDKKRAKENKKHRNTHQENIMLTEMNASNQFNMFHNQKIFNNNSLNGFIPSNNQTFNNDFAIGLSNALHALPYDAQLNKSSNNLPNNLINGISNTHQSNNVSNLQNKQINKSELESNQNKFTDLKKRNAEYLTETFITHGMSDQNTINKLINPFEEKRRPDSKLEMNAPSNQLNDNLTMIASNHLPHPSSDNIASMHQNMNLNYQMPIPFNQFHNPQMLNPPNLIPNLPVPPNLQQMNPILPFYLFSPPNNLPNDQLLNSFNNQFNRFDYQSFLQFHQQLYHMTQTDMKYNHLLNQQYANAQISVNSKNIGDVEAKKREIGETVHITQTVDSASDTNDPYLPNQIQDSDISSMCSNDSFNSRNGDLNCAETIPSDFKQVYDKLKPLNDSDEEEIKKS